MVVRLLITRKKDRNLNESRRKRKTRRIKRYLSQKRNKNPGVRRISVKNIQFGGKSTAKIIEKINKYISKINDLTIEMSRIITGSDDNELDKWNKNGLIMKLTGSTEAGIPGLRNSIYKKLKYILTSENIDKKKMDKIRKQDKIIRKLIGKPPSVSFHKYIKSRKFKFRGWGTKFSKKIGYGYYSIPYLLIDYFLKRRKMRKYIKKCEDKFDGDLNIELDSLTELSKNAKKLHTFMESHGLKRDVGGKLRKRQTGKLESSAENKRNAFEEQMGNVEALWEACKEDIERSIKIINEYIIDSDDGNHSYNIKKVLHRKNLPVKWDQIGHLLNKHHESTYSSKNFERKMIQIEKMECATETYMEYLIYSNMGIVVPYKNKCFCVPVYIQKIIFQFIKFWKTLKGKTSIFDYLTTSTDLQYNGYIKALVAELKKFTNGHGTSYQNLSKYCSIDHSAFDYIICCALIYRDDVYCNGHLFEKVYEYATNFLKTNNVIMYRWGKARRWLALGLKKKITDAKPIVGSWELDKDFTPKEKTKLQRRNYFKYYQDLNTSNKSFGIYLLPIMMKFDIHMTVMYFIEQLIENAHTNFNRNVKTTGGGVGSKIKFGFKKLVGNKAYKYREQENIRMKVRLDKRIDEMITQGFTNYDNEKIKDEINKIIQDYEKSIKNKYKQFESKSKVDPREGQKMIREIELDKKIAIRNIKQKISKEIVNPNRKSKQSEIIDNMQTFSIKIKKPMYTYLKDKVSVPTEVQQILDKENNFFDYIQTQDTLKKNKEENIRRRIEEELNDDQVNYNNLIGLGISPALTNYLLPRDQYIVKYTNGTYPELQYYKADKMYGNSFLKLNSIDLGKFRNKLVKLHKIESDIVRFGLGSFANKSVHPDSKNRIYNPAKCGKKCEEMYHSGIHLRIINDKSAYTDTNLPTLLYYPHTITKEFAKPKILNKINKADFYSTKSLKHPNLDDIEVDDILPDNLLKLVKDHIKDKTRPLKIESQEITYTIDTIWVEEIQQIKGFISSLRKKTETNSIGGNRTSKLNKKDKKIIREWVQKGGKKLHTIQSVLKKAEKLLSALNKEKKEKHVTTIARALQNEVETLGNNNVSKQFRKFVTSHILLTDRPSSAPVTDTSKTNVKEAEVAAQAPAPAPELSSAQVPELSSAQVSAQAPAHESEVSSSSMNVSRENDTKERVKLKGNDYIIEKYIGSGTFGDTFLIKNKNREKFLLKAFKKRDNKDVSLDFDKELQNLENIRKLDCKDHFTCLVDSDDRAKLVINSENYRNFKTYLRERKKRKKKKKKKEKQPKETPNHSEQVYTHWMIITFISGFSECNPDGACSLSDYINKGKIKISTDNAISIIGHLLEKLQILHDAGYAHRDIKPANIVLAQVDDKIVPHIIDFGFLCDTKRYCDGWTSNYFPNFLCKKFEKSKCISGTKESHTLQGSKQYDVYALGIIIRKIANKISNKNFRQIIIQFAEDHMIKDEQQNQKSINECVNLFRNHYKLRNLLLNK